MNFKKVTAVLCTLVMIFALCPMLCGCSIFNEYQMSSKSPTISSPDIIKDGTLTVGVFKNNLPLSASTEKGYQGIDCDVAAAIADELGLKVEYVELDKNASEFVNKDKIDIIMGANSTNVDSKVSLSNRYLTTAPVLFSLSEDDNNPTSISSLKIACQKGTGAASAATALFGETAVTLSQDLSTCFNDLASKKVNYVAAESAIGQFYAIQGNVKAYQVDVIGQTMTYNVGVSANKTNLLTAVNKALSTLNNNGIINAIVTNWLGENIDLSSLEALASSGTTTQSTTSSSSTSTSDPSAAGTSSANSSSSASGTSSSSGTTNSSGTSSSGTSTTN